MFTEIKKLHWFFKQRRKSYVVGILSLQILNILIILPPIFIGSAVDSISQGSITATELFQKLAILITIMITEYGLGCIWAYYIFQNAILIDLRLRLLIMNKVLGMPRTFFERFSAGDLMARATSDVETVSEMLGVGVLTFCDSITYLGTIILAMGFTVSWKLTFLSILPLPFFAIVTGYGGKYIHRLFATQQEVFSKMNDEVLEYINGIRVVRSYVLEDQSIAHFERTTKEVFDTSLKTEILAGSFWSLTKVFTTLSYAIAIGYGTSLVIDEQITLGSLISFNVYLSYLIWPMFSIGEFVNIAQRGATSIKRIYEVLDSKDDRIQSGRQTLDSCVDRISFKNYRFRYPSSQIDSLSDIDLVIDRGRTLGIVGKTGSGKSTLIKQLLKEYPIGEGELLISDLPIQNLDKGSLMEHIGYVSQENILFSKSVRENIRMGNELADEDSLLESLRLSDLEKDVQNFAQGLDTLVGERGVAISGGQKQRLSIARSLIKDPDILIMDDSLSAVDAKTESKIIENIRKNRRGKTTLIVTHRLSAVAHADEIIVLDGGRITQRGTHSDLVSQDGWYNEQYQIQQMEGENYDG